ncbi:uncharacterized protein LOC121869070 [Homarus americanus]|uniref:uncharacterized protein LOC121869070 n=1 Tax=Homarus americanus TaxID=6706 RepID=UPI001C493468|nr:uncharacterized protein LOC121869070 [Homarus americanus]
MVSLTSLLVLATVFTQTSQSIPKTSYLKLIDVWFVVLISEDFAIIVSLVYIEVLRLRHPTNTIKVVPVGSVMAWDTVVKRIKTNVDDDEISIRELRNRRLSMNRDESSSPVPDHQVSPMDRDDSHSPKPVPVRALKVNRILLNFFSVTLFVLILCFVAMCIFSIISK